MAVVHPADTAFWTDAHRYKDAESTYYSSLSKIKDNPTSSPPNDVNATKRSKKVSKNKQTDPNSCVSISQTTQTTTANVANIHTKDGTPGPALSSGGKKKRNKNKSKGATSAPDNSLAAQVHKARQQLQDQLQNCDKSNNTLLTDLVLKLEQDKLTLEQTVASLVQRMNELELTVSKFKSGTVAPSAAPPAAAAPPDDDDDVDLFGSDSEGEDETAAKIREERLAAYAAKKSKKPTLIAKSNIIFDVKPWDDETDMKELEAIVRSIQQDGLLWGAAKLVPLAYGINKLQISCVVEDDKVSVDEVQEKIEQTGSEFVQSVDIAAFNKI